MAQITTDRARIGPHRDRLEAEACEGAQVRHEHPVVGMSGGGLIDIEGIGILHQELARAHGPEPRADLVPELPRDLVEVLRQVLIGAHAAPEDLGDDLFRRRPEQHLAVVPVGDAEHLLAVGLVAAGFAPELGRLDRRHQNLDGARPVLLLADHRADLVEDAQAQGQPRIDAGSLLAHETGTQHQAVGNDLGLLGRLAQGWQEVAGETHGRPWKQRASGSAARPGTQHIAPGKHKRSRMKPGAGSAFRRRAVHRHGGTNPRSGRKAQEFLTKDVTMGIVVPISASVMAAPPKQWRPTVRVSGGISAATPSAMRETIEAEPITISTKARLRPCFFYA